MAKKRTRKPGKAGNGPKRPPAAGKQAKKRPSSPGGRARTKGRAGGRTGLVVAAAVALVTAVVVIAWFGKDLYGPVVPPSSRAGSASTVTRVRLYTATSDGKHLTTRTVKLSAASASSVQAAASAALTALMKDSSGTLPPGTRLRGVTLNGSTATVDLSSEAATGHTGSTGEILAIYSIVNTVTLNFPGIKDVQLLIDGKKTSTLAGHIDISYPIPPDRTLIEG